MCMNYRRFVFSILILLLFSFYYYTVTWLCLCFPCNVTCCCSRSFQVGSSLRLINTHRLGLKASAKPSMLFRMKARTTVPPFPKARTWWTARREQWRTWEWRTFASAPPAPWYEQHGATLGLTGSLAPLCLLTTPHSYFWVGLFALF